MHSKPNGYRVLGIKNSAIVLISREAGAPKDKGAGIELSVKMGDRVRKGDVLYTIYSNNYIRLSDAIKMSKNLEPIMVGKSFEENMILEKVFTEIPNKKVVILDR